MNAKIVDERVLKNRILRVSAYLLTEFVLIQKEKRIAKWRNIVDYLS